MDSTALHDLFRVEVNDTALPYLWTSPEIYAYMDDAQKMFCRRQGGIADATSAVTQFPTITAGTEYIALSPKILKIRSARRTTDGRDIKIMNFEELQIGFMTNDYGMRGSGHQLDSTPGEVVGLVSGMETNKLRLVRIPAQNMGISLIVYRMPLDEIVEGGQPLEIDEQHHRHLLLWMKHLAHMKQDAEAYDRGRSEEFGNAFLGYCDQAKAEREKREHTYRGVAYGGY